MGNCDKQRKEMSVLMDALGSECFARSSGVLSSILGDRSGWCDDWQSFDSPDFYRVFHDKVVGIEHFMVYSDGYTKNGSLQSAFGSVQSAIFGKYARWHDLALSSSPDDKLKAFGEMAAIATDLLKRRRGSAGDEMFFKSLCFGLFGNEKGKSGHAQKMGKYKEHLSGMFPGKPTVVGLLVEAVGNFDDVFLFDDGEFSKLAGLLPLSMDLLRALSAAIRCGADFVMFYRRSVDTLGMKTLKSRLLVIDDAVDCRPLGYFHGERVFERLPSWRCFDRGAKIDAYVRRSPGQAGMELVTRFRGSKSKVDMDSFFIWSLFGDTYVRHDVSFYSDVTVMAMVYALAHVVHSWRYVVRGKHSVGSLELCNCDGMALARRFNEFLGRPNGLLRLSDFELDDTWFEVVKKGLKKLSK